MNYNKFKKKKKIEVVGAKNNGLETLDVNSIRITLDWFVPSLKDIESD